MPGLDKTGPLGKGPMTGKGLGLCGLGRKLGRGKGRGLGRYFGWDIPLSKQDQKKDLEEYRKALKEELEDVEKDMAELDKNA